MATNSPKHKASSKEHSKKTLIIGAILLLVTAFAVAAFFFLQFLDPPTKQAPLSPQEEAITQQQEVVNKAKGGEKAAALTTLAGLYVNNNQPNKAIETRRESFNIEKNPNTASSIALLACEQKNTAVCQEYLQATIAGLKANPSNPNASFLPYYERRLVAVKQGNVNDEPSFMEGLEP